jgi:hypothetical protein
VEPELVQGYVEEGTLRIERRDFAYLGEESRTAARAARVAQEQGKFREYHDALYENQGSGGTLSEEGLVDLARQLGLDTANFESDRASGRFEGGRELSVGRLRLHTTNLVSGIMFVLLGVVFIAYEGTSALSGLYEENGAVEVAFAAEQWARSIASNVPDALVLAVVLAVTLALVIAAYNRRKPRNASTGKAKIR